MLKHKSIHSQNTNISEARILLGGISFSLTSTDIETIDRFNNAMIKSSRNNSPDFLLNINYVPSLKGTLSDKGLGLGQKISEISGRVLYGDKSIQGYFQWSHDQVQVFFEENVRPLTPAYLFSLVLSAFYILEMNQKGRKFNTIFLHAAGITGRKNAYIFTGPSGSGKTTVSNLSKKTFTVVNDECVQLSYEDGEYILTNTPILSDIYCTEKIRKKIKYIFFLSKSKSNNLVKIKGADAALKLIETIVYPFNFIFDGVDVMSDLLDCAVNITGCVPCYEMHFEKNDSLWTKIHGLETDNAFNQP